MVLAVNALAAAGAVGRTGVLLQAAEVLQAHASGGMHADALEDVDPR